MYLGLRAKMSDTVFSCIFQDAALSHFPNNTRIIAFVAAGMVYIQCLLDVKF